jgi:capsular polysaccharide transport system permease protein
MGNTQPPDDGASHGESLDPAYALLSRLGLARLQAVLAQLPDDTPEYQRQLLGALIAVKSRDWDQVRKIYYIAIPKSDVTGNWLAGRALALCEPTWAIPFLVSIVGQRGPDLTAAESYRVGRIAFAGGAWKEAMSAFAHVVRSNPNLLAARLGQGIAEFRSGKWDLAVSTLKSAAKQMPESVEAAGFLGFALMFANKMKEAESLIKSALDRAPRWFEARMRMGDLLLRSLRFREAEDWFASLAADHPQSPWVQYFHCRALQCSSHETRHLSDAERALQRLEIDNEGYNFIPGGISTGWYVIGTAYLHDRDYDRAVPALERAVHLAPHRGRYRLRLATALFELRQFAQALSVLQAGTFANTPEGATAALLRGICHLELKDAAQALLAFQESAKADPMSAEAFVALGRASLIEGDPVRAERALATAMRINPRLPSVVSAAHELELALGRALDDSAGLEQLQEFSIPPEFALNLADERLSEVRSLSKGLQSHCRAIFAVIRREMLGRYARNELGYIWAILQPILYVATLEAIFLVAQRVTPLGVTLEQFLITGIVPVVCFFMNVESKVTTAINANKNLLYFREVTTLNILVGAWLLEFLTAVTAMLVILAGLYLVGQPFTIKDKFEVLAALFGISMLAAVLGGLIGVLSLRWNAAIFLGRSINRTLFFLSGAFFYADQLPPKIREYILFNPLFHYVELVRDGFFLSYQAVYVTWTYPLLFIVPGLFFLLLSDRVFRRHVEA